MTNQIVGAADPRVVASRILRTASGDEVTVTIFEPQREPEEMWSCDFAILGAGFDLRRNCSGTDSLSALLFAIYGVRADLESADPPLAWEDAEPGDFGIARPIPTGYGPAVEARLIHVVNQEVARLSAIKWGRSP